jgi:hypothetical protein
MPIASVTRSVKYAQKGAPGKSGRIPYPAGEYNLYTSYICTDTVTPYVLDGKYYVMNRNTTWVGQGMPSNINSPRKDVAVNGSNATWTLVEDYTAIFVEILMANFAKLASAIFSGDYMFSQQGVDADGNPTSNYEEFNTGNFVPNLLLDFATGLFKGNKVELTGQISTASEGKRIVIDPTTNSIAMYDFLGNLVGKISFSTVEDYTSPVIELYDMAPTGVIGGKTTIMPGSVSLESLYFGDKYSVHISPYIGIQFRKNDVTTKTYGNS